MSHKTYVSLIAVAGIVMGLALATPALAQGPMRGNMPMHRFQGVFGTVSAVNGTTLTVTGKMKQQTTYTVDASKATVMKNGTSATLASVAVGDTVMVQGTVSGTSVVATMVRDGMPQKGQPRPTPSPVITGNGQPIVGGTITAISGSTITITNKSNVTYPIDASNATIEKGGKSATLSSVANGDSIVVQGTVNGTSIVASSVIDQGVPANNHAGFVGQIAHFFSGLFGFF